MAHSPLLRTTPNCPVAFEPRPPSASAFAPLAGVPGAYLLTSLLSPDECDQIIAATEALEYAPKQSRRPGPPIRTNTRVLYEAHADLTEALSGRMYPHVAGIDVSTAGRWRLAGPDRYLNERWRMNRYGEAEQFFPHYDTGYAFGRDRRSLLSVIIYLNDDFDGGETVFFPGGQTRDEPMGERDADEVRLRPVTGTALIFHHFGPLSPRHSGLAPTGCRRPKYVIRTDLFFERDPPPASEALFGRHADTRRYVLLLGPPGAGQSTQLDRVSGALGYTGVDFGRCVADELARRSDLGARIEASQRQQAAARGEAFAAEPVWRRPAGWLPDGLCRELLERRLATTGPTPGLVLDGFPRLRSQCNLLEGARWDISAVVLLHVDDDTQVGRLPGDAAIASRTETWRQDTRRLLEHYAKRDLVIEVDGAGTRAQVTGAILGALSQRRTREATSFFTPELRELLGDLTTDGINRSSRHDCIVLRYQPTSGPALYLKLVPPWGASVISEAAFLRSPTAARLGLQVPACRGLFVLGQDVPGLVTEELPGVSAKRVAQACTADRERLALVQELARALARIHGAPVEHALAERTTAALLRQARARLEHGEVSQRNFTAKYGTSPETPDTQARLLERLEHVARNLAEGPSVVLHGDPCLPNFVVDAHGTFVGCLDLAWAGLGDRYWDLALARWSVRHNLGERWAASFLDLACDGRIDRARLDFFTDLGRFLL